MKFSDLSLSDILRFVITGYALYFVKIFTGVKFQFSIGGGLQKQFAIIVVGIVFYYLYRTLIYPWFLQTVDMWNKQSVRNLVDREKRLSWGERNDLWLLIAHKENLDDVDKNRLWSHSIHMLYVLSLSMVVGVVIVGLSLLPQDFLRLFDEVATFSSVPWVKGICLFLLAASFIVAALTSEIALERRIYRSLFVSENSNFAKEESLSEEISDEPSAVRKSGHEILMDKVKAYHLEKNRCQELVKAHNKNKPAV